MTKELLIQLFLLINKFFFALFSIFPTRKKMVFLCDFGDNAAYTIQALNEQGYSDIIVLKTSRCNENFSKLNVKKIILFEMKDLRQYISGLYHISTCKTLLIDNYVPLLHVLPKHIECIQLWHAAGAIKKFALSDPSIAYRTPAAVRRFRKVYKRMDKVVVGSEQMAKIFRLAFHKDPDAFLRTGIPRTDFYFDESRVTEVRTRLFEKYPILREKKVLLYAPTFRDLELTTQQIPIHFTKLMQDVGDEYVLIIKLHPAVQHTVENLVNPQIIVLDNQVPIHEVLTVTDCLISDYSSIPFEYAFFNKPQIFYPYDLDQYRMSRGFWSDYPTMVPGPVVDSDEELVHAILHLDFDATVMQDYSSHWNTYSTGQSSKNLAEYLLTHL